MEAFLSTLAEHGGPEWVLIIWLLWRIERMDRRAETRALRDQQLKLKIAQAIGTLTSKILRRD